MTRVESLIQHYQLEPLPEEGGYFRRIYTDTLPAGNDTDPPPLSCIYYLITPTAFSALHRIPSTEVFCFQAGDPVEMLQISSKGQPSLHKLGMAPDYISTVVVPGHTWQGTRLVAGGKWAFFTVAVAPAFTWDRFELGQREKLTAAFPDLQEQINAFSRESAKG